MIGFVFGWLPKFSTSAPRRTPPVFGPLCVQLSSGGVRAALQVTGRPAAVFCHARCVNAAGGSQPICSLFGPPPPVQQAAVG